MNIFRKLCADAIERNGGYSRGYHERAALEWNVEVPAYGVSEFDELFERSELAEALKDYHGIDKLRVAEEDLAEVKQTWNHEMENGTLWQWIVEDMRNGVTDDDTYHTVRPEIAARFGLDYYRFPKKYRRRTVKDTAYCPAKVEGWVLEHPFTVEQFDVKWEFHGRGGKHLCLVEFEGRSLEHSSDDLAERIREDNDGSYPNWWCQRLLAFIRECDLCFTREIVKAEWVHQATYLLAQRLEEIHSETDESEAEMAERD